VTGAAGVINSIPANVVNANSGTRVGKGWPEILDATPPATVDLLNNYWVYTRPAPDDALTFEYVGNTPIRIWLTNLTPAGNPAPTRTVSGDVVETSVVIPLGTTGQALGFITLTPTKSSGRFTITTVDTLYILAIDGAVLPSGTVGSINTTAKTMTLATSSGTWGPVNAGHYVIGPTKTGPAANVKLYCKLDAAGAVSDLQSVDPGFTAWTPAGTGPYTGTVTFPATLPSGAAPDTDLPAGTTITVEVQATNTAGTDSAKSNVLTPA
jgi:hypothetical protein